MSIHVHGRETSKKQRTRSGAKQRTLTVSAQKLRRWEKIFIVALCVTGALRVFVYSAAFPFFNNVDEQAQVDLVLKYGRGHWPNAGVEHFDADAGRLILLYGTSEYFYGPETVPGGVLPRPLWQTPGV